MDWVGVDGVQAVWQRVGKHAGRCGRGQLRVGLDRAVVGLLRAKKEEDDDEEEKKDAQKKKKKLCH